MMIHKIEPHKYYPEFRSQEPSLPIICCYSMEKRSICPPVPVRQILPDCIYPLSRKPMHS